MHNLWEMIMITGGMAMRIVAAFLIGSGLLAQSGPPLPGTRALDGNEDLAEKLMDGAHLYVERKIRESVISRQRHWRRDFASTGAYEESVKRNRARFLEKIGLVDSRVPGRMERFGDDASPALVAETPAYRVYQGRWPVLEGVHGEGLLLEPVRAPVCFAVALADADQTPEQSAGLAAGLDAEEQIARRLAESGCLVVAPALVDRSARFSGRPDIRITDQPHREWIYRQAFQMGRHIIGYEVQKVMAAVDWAQATPFVPKSPLTHSARPSCTTLINSSCQRFRSSCVNSSAGVATPLTMTATTSSADTSMEILVSIAFSSSIMILRRNWPDRSLVHAILGLPGHRVERHRAIGIVVQIIFHGHPAAFHVNDLPPGGITLKKRVGAVHRHGQLRQMALRLRVGMISVNVREG